MKYVLVAVLTAIIVGLGVTAYFEGWLPTITFNKPQAVSVENSEVLNVPSAAPATSPSASPSATPSAAVKSQDNQTILNAVKAAQ
jgi:hypothetical protein